MPVNKKQDGTGYVLANPCHGFKFFTRAWEASSPRPDLACQVEQDFCSPSPDADRHQCLPDLGLARLGQGLPRRETFCELREEISNGFRPRSLQENLADDLPVATNGFLSPWERASILFKPTLDTRGEGIAAPLIGQAGWRLGGSNPIFTLAGGLGRHDLSFHANGPRAGLS